MSSDTEIRLRDGIERLRSKAAYEVYPSGSMLSKTTQISLQEAYTAYAEALGKSGCELTDNEKRQAFFNHVLENAPVPELGQLYIVEIIP